MYHSQLISSSSSSSSLTTQRPPMKLPFPPPNTTTTITNSLRFLSIFPRRSRRRRHHHRPSMDYAAAITPVTPTKRQSHRKDKLVVILGATGCGKSRLSLDLAARFPCEIINADKMQVYRGLDITTNKLPLSDRLSVPHHLLGQYDSFLGDLTPTQYRLHASAAITEIISRKKIPLLVGGSNSLVYALLAAHFSPHHDVFGTSNSPFCSDLRYKCCFLWVDVSGPVLDRYLEVRVDEMLGSGMLEELERYYDSGEVDESEPGTGLRNAIGVPEFEKYFRSFSSRDVYDGSSRSREVLYSEAVREIKENTRRLARRQVEKILRLERGWWDLHRLDATEAVRAAMRENGGGGPPLPAERTQSEIWEWGVVEPSVKIVKQFLEDDEVDVVLEDTSNT
ncbi:Adenylate isopentenyltransferase-like protein [Drosera capensis]